MTEKNNVYSAIAKAMGEVKRISKDSRNTEQKYDFASIDDFMAMVGPICASNGLVTIIDESAREFVEKPGKYGPTQWVSIEYQITTYHASGESLPTVRRHVEVIRNGPQAYGAAQSYILKQYYRGLLAIPTGDKDDPDHGTVQEEPAASRQNVQRSHRDTKPDPAQIAIDSLNNADTLDALAAIWQGQNFPRAHPEVIAAKDRRKAELRHAENDRAAIELGHSGAPRDGLENDEIPY